MASPSATGSMEGDISGLQSTLDKEVDKVPVVGYSRADGGGGYRRKKLD